MHICGLCIYAAYRVRRLPNASKNGIMGTYGKAKQAERRDHRPHVVGDPEGASDKIRVRFDRDNERLPQQVDEAGESDLEAGSESLHAAYFSEVKKAYAEFVRHAGAIVRAGKVGWQGMAWWLERTNRDFMAKQQIQADDEGKVTVVIGGKPMSAKAVIAKPADASDA